MQRFLIEREIPHAGAMTGPELCHASQVSNAALEKLAPRVQWQHSYVAADRIFCIYLAETPEGVREHAASAASRPIASFPSVPSSTR